MVTKRFLLKRRAGKTEDKSIFKRSQTTSTVPQFNYVIKVRGLKGVKLTGDNCEKDKFRPTYNLLSRPTFFLLHMRRAKALKACWAERISLYS